MKDEVFDKLKKNLMSLDPVYFCENFLTLDGKPFCINGNGYRPFADIYRYIGIKALEPNSKPVILVKGRQVGGTTMASALQMYFMGSGIFGVGNKPPIRVIHAFPQLELAAAYSKTKLNTMILSSVSLEDKDKKPGAKVKSIMQSLMDQTSATNDSLHFKQFIGGNHIWIESTGLTGDRLRGRTSDVIFFDECFPYDQNILTSVGKIPIGKLFNMFEKKLNLPQVCTFNEKTQKFEYKNIIKAWKRDARELYELKCENRNIKVTGNHKFLTIDGWKKVEDMIAGDVIKTSHPETCQISYCLNDDQYQIVLGSFLGDGHTNKLINENSNDIFKKYRLVEQHGIKQSDYCNWKASMFNVKTYLINENGFAKTPAIRFNTKTFIIKNKFPIGEKKHCPQWVLDDLDARGLAIWFMDDGAVNNNIGAVFNTCSFDEDSQKRIVDKLKDFGIKSEYRMYYRNDGRGYFSIYINKVGFNKLKEIICPYMHDNLNYKCKNFTSPKYVWNNKFEDFGLITVKSVKKTNEKKVVYDIEVEDNHNFIASSSRLSKGLGGLIAHNCQDTTSEAIGNSLKILTTAKYGKSGKGVQVFFGTPRRKGSDYHKMWQVSSQQYYYLGCKDCKKHFPLYTPESDDWEKIWITGFIVKCIHCGCEQDKRDAAERGKWVASKDQDDDDCQMIGFHINQLYMPHFTKEDIINEKPGIHPINTDRVYKNEVLGEFFQGDTSPITIEEIREKCGEPGRKFRASIAPGEEPIIVCGIDYGARNDLEQLANPHKAKSAGQSYSTAVVLVAKGPNLLSIEFATKFKRNDIESKKGLIDQLMRQYSLQLTIGDIGYSNDFSELMHTSYGDKYLVSRAQNKINNRIKYNQDSYPKEIQFERDFYIAELYSLMKSGNIKFPFGDYEKIAWLVAHCASMEIKPSISKFGDPTIHYIKGGTPNDGFMALLNAYIAYKFILTSGFSNNNPILQQTEFKNKPLIIAGYIPRKF